MGPDSGDVRGSWTVHLPGVGVQNADGAAWRRRQPGKTAEGEKA